MVPDKKSQWTLFAFSYIFSLALGIVFLVFSYNEQFHPDCGEYGTFILMNKLIGYYYVITPLFVGLPGANKVGETSILSSCFLIIAALTWLVSFIILQVYIFGDGRICGPLGTLALVYIIICYAGVLVGCCCACLCCAAVSTSGAMSAQQIQLLQELSDQEAQLNANRN